MAPCFDLSYSKIRVSIIRSSTDELTENLPIFRLGGFSILGGLKFLRLPSLDFSPPVCYGKTILATPCEVRL